MLIKQIIRIYHDFIRTPNNLNHVKMVNFDNCVIYLPNHTIVLIKKSKLQTNLF